MIKGYKGFDKDLKCRGFQYKENGDFEEKGEVKCCNNGFHFCENPLDVFGYYAPSDSRYYEVEGSGQVDKSNSDDSKVAVSKLHVGMEIGLSGIIKAGVKFIFDKVDWNNNKESNTGYHSAAINTGDHSAATNTGNHSAATNTGNHSAATNTGYQSAATNEGNYSAATNTGNQSAATNTGNQSAATNTGNHSAATNTGNQSAATNTGNHSAATNEGNYSAATNTGTYSAATVKGKESIAMAMGYGSKARGSLGCWIVVAEWFRDKGGDYHIKDIKSTKVDGETIKADTYYMLKDGKFVESEE